MQTLGEEEGMKGGLGCQHWWVMSKSGCWHNTYSGRDLLYDSQLQLCSSVCLCVWQNDGWKVSQNWHLAKCEQGTNQRPLRRHLAPIRAVFGLITAEQVDAGQFSWSTCSRLKIAYWWGCREEPWLHLQLRCACVHVPVLVCVCSSVLTRALHKHLYPQERQTIHNPVLHQSTLKPSESRKCSSTGDSLLFTRHLFEQSPAASSQATTAKPIGWVMCGDMFNVTYYTTQQAKTELLRAVEVRLTLVWSCVSCLRGGHSNCACPWLSVQLV